MARESPVDFFGAARTGLVGMAEGGKIASDQSPRTFGGNSPDAAHSGNRNPVSLRKSEAVIAADADAERSREAKPWQQQVNSRSNLPIPECIRPLSHCQPYGPLSRRYRKESRRELPKQNGL